MSTRTLPPVVPVLAAALLALAAAAPDSAAAQQETEEVDCESVCRVFPDRAPPQCTCEAQIVSGSSGGGASGGEYAEPAVRELHGQVQESWREATAPVADYTVVQSASVITENGPMQLGPPVVLHFEKESIDGYPMYRFVSPAELSNREQRARGEPTAGEVAEGMGQAINLLGGALANAAGSAAGSGEGGAAGLGFTLPPEWSRELAELNQFFTDLDEQAEMETRADLEDKLFGENKFWEHARIYGNYWCSMNVLRAFARPDEYTDEGLDELDINSVGPNPSLSDDGPWADNQMTPGGLPMYECTWLWAEASDLEDADLAGLMGEEQEGYEIERADMLLLKDNLYGDVTRIAVRARLRPSAAGPGAQRITVSRVNAEFAREASADFVPRKEQIAMSGASALMGPAAQGIMGIVNDIYVVVHTIHKILVNEGSPTREKIAELMAELMGESGATGGLPGS